MNENTQPLVLVTNDDGIEAPGVRRLIDCLRPMAKVVCVCPSHPRSGMSMALTVRDPLRIKRIGDYGDTPMYSVEGGTPADCVKIARHEILDRLPDMIVSGINHGSNAGVNVLYSGTMGAALEGCALGVPSVGFSLTNHSMDADFSPCYPFVKPICEAVLREGLPDGVCLNVNIPDCDPAPVRMRVVRQCHSSWSDEYVKYTDPWGKPFYIISGHFVNDEPDNPDTDEWCMSHGITSIVPVSLDRTAPVPGLVPAPVSTASGDSDASVTGMESGRNVAPRPITWTPGQLRALAALQDL